MADSKSLQDKVILLTGASQRCMEMNGCDKGFKVDIHPFDRIPAPGWVAPDIDRKK